MKATWGIRFINRILSQLFNNIVAENEGNILQSFEIREDITIFCNISIKLFAIVT
jgi:hypothetical protein